jgi:hypothetical protein
MTWLVWRLHRKAALWTLVGLVLLAAFLVPTGLEMHHAYDRDVAGCVSAAGTGLLVDDTTCNAAAFAFFERFKPFAMLAGLFMALPLAVGLFWGAPLVAREIEQGTHRMVWTQGVGRLRWAAVTFGLALAFTLAVAAAYAWLFTWWTAPLSRASAAQFAFPAFDLVGVAPVAYTLFAVGLGILAGTVGRRLVPAMAILLVAFVTTRTVVGTLLRPHYAAPLEFTYPTTTPSETNNFSGVWVLQDEVRFAGGGTFMRGAAINCAGGSSCVREPGEPELYNWISYQPADRFWPFQYIEAAIFAGLALVLLVAAIRRLRKII